MAPRSTQSCSGSRARLFRLAIESAKPNDQRLPDYTDARRASLELGLFSPAPIYDDFEKVKLADSLAFMRDELGADNAIVKKVLGGKSPECASGGTGRGNKAQRCGHAKATWPRRA